MEYGAAHRDMQLALEPFGRPLHREGPALGGVSEGQVPQRRHAAYLHAVVARMLQGVQDWPVDAPGHLAYRIQRGIDLWRHSLTISTIADGSLWLLKTCLHGRIAASKRQSCAAACPTLAG